VRVIVVEPGAVATELTDHITHGQTKQGVEQFYDATAIAADDIAQIIAFAVSRAAQRVAQRDPRPTYGAAPVTTQRRRPRCNASAPSAREPRKGVPLTDPARG
jgi:NAD(P)-dependent dehydrogenase (short-subunit alcohol dehydrogenase family)